jgi:hypothetical protein
MSNKGTGKLGREAKMGFQTPRKPPVPSMPQKEKNGSVKTKKGGKAMWTEERDEGGMSSSVDSDEHASGFSEYSSAGGVGAAKVKQADIKYPSRILEMLKQERENPMWTHDKYTVHLHALEEAFQLPSRPRLGVMLKLFRAAMEELQDQLCYCTADANWPSLLAEIDSCYDLNERQKTSLRNTYVGEFKGAQQVYRDWDYSTKRYALKLKSSNTRHEAVPWMEEWMHAHTECWKQLRSHHDYVKQRVMFQVKRWQTLHEQRRREAEAKAAAAEEEEAGNHSPLSTPRESDTEQEGSEEEESENHSSSSTRGDFSKSPKRSSSAKPYYPFIPGVHAMNFHDSEEEEDGEDGEDYEERGAKDVITSGLTGSVTMTKEEATAVLQLINETIDKVNAPASLIGKSTVGFTKESSSIKLDVPMATEKTFEDYQNLLPYLVHLRRYIVTTLAANKKVVSLSVMIDPVAMSTVLWPYGGCTDPEFAAKATDVQKMRCIKSTFESLYQTNTPTLKDQDFLKHAKLAKESKKPLKEVIKEGGSLVTYLSTIQRAALGLQEKLTPEKIVQMFMWLIPEELRNYMFNHVLHTLQKNGATFHLEDYFSPANEKGVRKTFVWFLDSAKELQMHNNGLSWHTILKSYTKKPVPSLRDKTLVDSLYPPTSYRESISEVPSVYSKLGRVGQVARSEDTATRVCYHCGEEGHIARDCPDKQGKKAAGAGSCHNCGEEGHYKKDCPKKVSEGSKCTNCNGSNHACGKCSKPCKHCLALGKTNVKSALEKGHSEKACLNNPANADQKAKYVAKQKARKVRQVKKKAAKRAAEDAAEGAASKKKKVEEIDP